MNRLLCLGLVFTLIPAAFAETEIRRAGAHVHSVAAAQLAVEGVRVDLMLQIPGANLVGFEHPPRGQEQADLLASVRARLEARDWLMLPDSAGCTADVSIELPGFTGDGHGNGHAHHDHDHHHHDHEHVHQDHGDGHAHRDHHHEHADHEHGRAGDEHDGHAEFRVIAAVDCERAPEWLEIRLFEGWPDNRSIRVDAISTTRQWRAELSADQTRIALQ